jgi:hypothetical protein
LPVPAVGVPVDENAFVVSANVAERAPAAAAESATASPEASFMRIETVASSPGRYEALSVEIVYEATVAEPTRTETGAALTPEVTAELVFVVSVIFAVPAATPVKSHETLPVASEKAVHDV